MVQVRRIVTPTDCWVDPSAEYNAFIDLVAKTDYRDLAASQRPAHLVFWYEAEVQNGGHLQYFMNRGVDRVEETIQALSVLGAARQADILRKAFSAWTSQARMVPANAAEYIATSLEGEFADLDTMFHALDEPEGSGRLQDVLERHLAANLEEFVVHAAADTENDRLLESIGNLADMNDQGRSILTALLQNPDPRVRMTAAIELFPMDREAAKAALEGIAARSPGLTGLEASFALSRLCEEP